MKFVVPKKENMPSGEFFDASWAYMSKNPFIREVYFKRLRMALDKAGDGQGYVLDIATGSGIILPSFKGRGKVVAIDIHGRMGEVAKFLEKEGIDNVMLVRASIEHLPFKRIFDFAFCLSVLEHIPDIDKVLEEVSSVTKQEGKIILGYPIESLLTNTAWKVLGIEDDIHDEHVTDHNKLRKSIKSRFKNSSKSKLPPLLPDLVSLYEVYSCDNS